ncbi:MAG: DUF5666 domain-containing protein [Chloroflexota bacterium]
MSRSRVIFYAVLGLGLLIVGSQAVFAATESAGATANAIVATATLPPDRSWNIAGTIQAMNGEFWNVQGFAILVTDDTQITGDLPTVGSYVRAGGVVQSDGTWLTTNLHVGQASGTATPTAAPTDTSTPLPTATAIPSATATPTTTPIVNLPVVFHPSPALVHVPVVVPARPGDDDGARPGDRGASNAHANQERRHKGGGARDQGDHGNRRAALDEN